MIVDKNFFMENLSWLELFPNLTELTISDQHGSLELRELKAAPNLESLTITGCHISHLSDQEPEFGFQKEEDYYIDDWGFFEELTHLDLSNNWISNIDPLAPLFPQLQYLDLSNNKISRIYCMEAGLPNCESLNLSGNNIPVEGQWISYYLLSIPEFSFGMQVYLESRIAGFYSELNNKYFLFWFGRDCTEATINGERADIGMYHIIPSESLSSLSVEYSDIFGKTHHYDLDDFLRFDESVSQCPECGKGYINWQMK